jgi:hypothetical protein
MRTIPVRIVRVVRTSHPYMRTAHVGDQATSQNSAYFSVRYRRATWKRSRGDKYYIVVRCIPLCDAYDEQVQQKVETLFVHPEHGPWSSAKSSGSGSRINVQLIMYWSCHEPNRMVTRYLACRRTRDAPLKYCYLSFLVFQSI